MELDHIFAEQYVVDEADRGRAAEEQAAPALPTLFVHPFSGQAELTSRGRCGQERLLPNKPMSLPGRVQAGKDIGYRRTGCLSDQCLTAKFYGPSALPDAVHMLEDRDIRDRVPVNGDQVCNLARLQGP